jgi:hypothetical protein
MKPPFPNGVTWKPTMAACFCRPSLTQIGAYMRQILKSKSLAMAFAAALILVFGAVGVKAQMITEIEAKIPFAFSVENTRLPAGDYFIRPAEDLTPMLEIVSADNKVAAFILPESAQAKQTPKVSELAFDKVGNQEFLREIWVEGSIPGYSFPKSKAEVSLEKKGGKTEQHRMTVKHNKTRTHKP